MFNPNNPKHIKRLLEAARHSRKQLQPFRKHRFDAIQQYVGYNYSDTGAREIVPANLLELAVSIYVRQLVAANPQVLISTPHRELKASAVNRELAINHLIKEIRLQKTIEEFVLDAMFSVGIVKVGMVKSGVIEIEGFPYDVGQPYAGVVSLDDWVVDMSAKRYEEAAYSGNRYRVLYDEIMESDAYMNTEKLQPTLKKEMNIEGEQKAESISQGTAQYDRDEYQDYVDLWDYWLPKEGLIITVPADDGNEHAQPIRIVEWAGPESGPYHLLGFGEVSDSIMPLSPVALWRDFHDLSNEIFRKLGRQAKRQKESLVYQGTSAEDAERQVNSLDGEAIREDTPGATRVLTYGGPNQINLAFLMQMMNMFNRFSGNLDTLGGLAAQSETLGQDKLLTESASKRVQAMQDRVTGVVKEVISSLSWQLVNDPLIQLPLTKRIPGVDQSIDFVFSAESLEGDFDDYNYDIEPFSMQYKSPATRLNTINVLMQNTVIPAIPMMGEQGIQINWDGYMRMVAKLTGMVELEDLLIFGGEPTIPKPGVIGQPPRPPMTQRTNIRKNIPGSTERGQTEVQINNLLGKQMQPAQQASLGRTTG